MDNTKELHAAINKLMDMASTQPPEKQLRVIWIIIGAMFVTIEHLKAYQDAGFESLRHYVEACEKADEKAMVDSAVLTGRLMNELQKMAQEAE